MLRMAHGDIVVKGRILDLLQGVTHPLPLPKGGGIGYLGLHGQCWQKSENND